ncbi:MAG: hypothetical protein J2P54_07760 [Bradyrhizobiaceae bacterium]|nr:hypothetical protein [Bradyrhizobiaceae bacterium]
MGILTDVLVASPSEAEAICRDLCHFENWPCWQVKGFDNLIFADLLRALGAEAEAESLARGETLIYELNTQGGPWIFHLPDVIPKALSTLEGDDIPDLAKRWLQGENAGYDLFERWLPGKKSAGFEDAVVENVVLALKDLRNLSKQAVAANKSLLLWVCL